MSTQIPHPPGRVPLIGDIRGMDRQRPNQKTLWQFSQLGPIYRRTILGTKITFVGSSEYAAAVFDERRWQRYRGKPIMGLRDLVGDALFTASNDSVEWLHGHEALAAGFTQESIRRYHSDMLDVSANLLEELSLNPAQDTLELTTSAAALDVIGRAGFSHPFPMGSPESRTFTDVLTRRLAYTQENGIPFIGGLMGAGKRRQADQDSQMLHNTVGDVINQRRQTGIRSNDLLDIMLNPRDGIEPFDDESIRNQVLTFLVAGHETTGNLLAFALYFIGQDPALLASIREERASVVGDGTLTAVDVPRLRYLRSVISESLRLWPTAPGIFRQARERTTIGPYDFEAGEWVFVLLLAVHRDQQVWGPDADTFRPERFGEMRTPPTFKPFGTGPRACIGRQFALHEAAVLLSEVTAHVDIDSRGNNLNVEENLTLRPHKLQVAMRTR